MTVRPPIRLLHLVLESPCWTGLCAESVEKHEPASDIAIAVLESLKALDPNRPIREADIVQHGGNVRFMPKRTFCAAVKNVVIRSLRWHG